MSNEIPKNPKNPKIVDELKLDFNDATARAREVFDSQPPEVQRAVEQGKSFYDRNKKTIITVAVVYIGFKMNKRMVRKATVKGISKALKGLNVPEAKGMTKVSTLAAKDLMVDDHFQLGGQLYRVYQKLTNDFGEPVLRFVSPENATKVGFVVIRPDVMIDTLNQ